jgi:hypothetical protein
MLHKASTGLSTTIVRATTLPCNNRSMDIVHGSILSRVWIRHSCFQYGHACHDWAGDETNFPHFPREIAEKTLAHAVEDEKDAAKRRLSMDDWAAKGSRAV